MAAVLAGWVAKSSMQKYFPKTSANLLPVFAFSIPAIQFFLFKYSGDLGPIYGPLITELVTYFPLAALSFYSAAVALDAVDLSRFGERVQNSGPAIASYFVFTAVEKVSTEYIHRNMGSSPLFTRTGLQVVVAAFYALALPSKTLFLAVVPFMHFALFNVHVPLARTTSALNSTLQLDGFSLIARQESLTGYISVLDNVKSGYRVMRCDHSLLGGEFIPPPNYHWIVKDPIYSIFTTLEAVRLVEADFSNTLPAARTTNDLTSALVMYVPYFLKIFPLLKPLSRGLGIGTAPAALVAHGIHTTTIEIDPVVHAFATKYFSLPQNHTTIIGDAVTYVARAQAAGHSWQTYSYIIHDVFTGGAEPADLFTQEFIQGLSDLLKPEGVISIVSVLTLPSSPSNTSHLCFQTQPNALTNFPSRTTPATSSSPPPPSSSAQSSPSSPLAASSAKAPSLRPLRPRLPPPPISQTSSSFASNPLYHLISASPWRRMSCRVRRAGRICCRGMRCAWKILRWRGGERGGC